MSDIAESVWKVEDLPAALRPLREEILAELVMISQIPAPAGQESARVRHLLDRFAEAGLPEAGNDEKGNAVGTIPGRTGERTIMVVAHLDTIVPDNVDHNVTVEADRVLGPGISDNALGAAVVSILPTCLERLGIELDSNLALVGSVQSLHRSNEDGLGFHLDHAVRPVDFGICMEGVQLGRLNYFSIGTLRGDVTCDVRPLESRSYGSQSAVVVLNHIINRILSIEIPQRPFTKISIGKVHAGRSYDVEPDHAELGFEVNSHDDKMIDRIQGQIANIVGELSARHAVNANLDCFFRRHAGGLSFSHPLVKAVLEVMEKLDIRPDQGHSPSGLSQFIQRNIPAVTLGITQGEKHQRKQPDQILIGPIHQGVSQLLGLILAIDSGQCDTEPQS